jgi:hypothetical protein
MTNFVIVCSTISIVGLITFFYFLNDNEYINQNNSNNEINIQDFVNKKH